MSSMNKLKIAIIGATGYTGLDLVYLLSKHSRIKILSLCATKNLGKSINYFKKQIGNKVDYCLSKNLRKSLIQIMNDIKIFKKKNNTILLSPASASYDQFLNFEKRGEEFKRLCKIYARKYV